MIGIAILCGIVLLFLLVVLYGKPLQTSLSVLKIAVSFMQVVSGLGDFTLVLPVLIKQPLNKLVSALSISQLDFFHVFSIDCFFGYHANIYTRIWIAVVTPLVLIGFLVIIHLLHHAFKYLLKTSEQAPLLGTREKSFLARNCFLVLLLCYPAVSTTILSIYSKKTIDNITYLTADYSVIADTEQYQSYTQTVIPILIAIYPIGIPLFFLAVIRYVIQLEKLIELTELWVLMKKIYHFLLLHTKPLLNFGKYLN